MFTTGADSLGKTHLPHKGFQGKIQPLNQSFQFSVFKTSDVFLIIKEGWVSQVCSVVSVPAFKLCGPQFEP